MSAAVLFVLEAADADGQKGDSRPAPAALRRESGSQLRPADGDFFQGAAGSPPTFKI